MPYIRAFPTWVTLNSANYTTSTGMQDPVTGQPEPGGALNVGDYADLTNQEAYENCNPANGLLFEGRYRYVQVDSSATAANVKTGTIGYLRAGGSSGSVKTVVIATAGSGQTNGTYQITGVGGGGTGAVVQVVIAGGVITNASVITGGYGYVGVPTFTVAYGGTPGTLAAQLDSSPNMVTSYDQAVAYGSAVRPVAFLNSITPGNYGFVQELGTATVLAGGTLTSATSNAYVNATTAGVVDTTVSTGSPIGTTVGRAIDLPVVNALFKCYLTGPVVQD